MWAVLWAESSATEWVCLWGLATAPGLAGSSGTAMAVPSVSRSVWKMAWRWEEKWGCRLGLAKAARSAVLRVLVMVGV